MLSVKLCVSNMVSNIVNSLKYLLYKINVLEKNNIKIIFERLGMLTVGNNVTGKILL